MRKVIYSLLFLCASLVSFTSCNDDETTDTKITYYVTFNLTGGEVYTIPVGTAYSEPGFTAAEGDNDVTSSVSVDGTVDGNTVGFYPVTYSATNVDGFESSITRNVFVYDPSVTADLSGDYVTAAGTHRQRGTATTPYPGYKVTLTQVAPGVFYITDWLGGYYDQSAGYGSSYACVGYLGLNADNTISGLYGHVAGWGDSFSEVSGNYDPATGTVTLDVVYAGMLFHSVLTK